ncbi:MAG: preprotein translocase subunit TatC [Deltaproteobacteria bacterium]|nr:preprotein translocase subunit TatC [Deltaproteobacteria bacterium]MBM4323066.1 preprotein translocase subunit TatC [Deltaproteobacteria bacterium]
MSDIHLLTFSISPFHFFVNKDFIFCVLFESSDEISISKGPLLCYIISGIHYGEGIRMEIKRGELFESLGNLRKSFFYIIGAVILFGIILFPFTKELLRHLHRSLQEDLVAYGIPEAFLSLIKLTLFASLFLSIPIIFFYLWKAFSPLFRKRGLESSFFVPLVAMFLFYSGAAFCYFVTLPFGIQFLMSYQSATIKPMISVAKYISFCVVFIFAFGLVFQLPLILALLSYIRVVNASFLTRNRRYAILIMAILSAVLTPTPDVFNMALMGGPLYVLFEIGILLVKIIEGKRTASDHPSSGFVEK